MLQHCGQVVCIGSQQSYRTQQDINSAIRMVLINCSIRIIPGPCFKETMLVVYLHNPVHCTMMDEPLLWDAELGNIYGMQLFKDSLKPI